LKDALAARGVFEAGRDTDEIVLPDFCPEFELPELKKRVAEAAARGVKRFRVTSLYGFQLLEGVNNFELTASYPLPICNSFAVQELARLGAGKTTAWVELEEAALKALADRCAGSLELFAFGRIPLMSTRLEIPVTGEVTDGRGARFKVVREAGLTLLFPDKVLSLTVPQDLSTYLDLTHADLEEPRTDSFNYLRDFA
jgi:putative protease